MFVTKRKFEELKTKHDLLRNAHMNTRVDINNLSLELAELRAHLSALHLSHSELNKEVKHLNHRVSSMEVAHWKELNPQKLKVGGKVKYLGKAGVILEVKFFNILDSNELHTFTRTIYSWQYFVKTKDFNGWVFERDLV